MLYDLAFEEWVVECKKNAASSITIWERWGEDDGNSNFMPEVGFSFYGHSFNQLLFSWQHNPEVLFPEKRKCS